MKQIIGNQDREKTSKVDTEKWKEHRAYYSNPKNIKNIPQAPMNEQNLENKLRYEFELPRLHLKPMPNYAVSILTLEDYDTLMQVYEAGGWHWKGNASPTENPHPNIKGLCMLITDGFTWSIKKACKENNTNIITIKKFYASQKITPKMLNELNEWYDARKPLRSSTYLWQ